MVIYREHYSRLSKFKPGIEFKYSDDEDDYWYKIDSYPYLEGQDWAIDICNAWPLIIMFRDQSQKRYIYKNIIFREEPVEEG